MFSFSVPVWLMVGNVVASIILSILLINRVYDKRCLLANNLSGFIYSYLSIACIFLYALSAGLCYIYIKDTPLKAFRFWYGAWIVFLLMGLFVLTTGSKKKWRKRKSRLNSTNGVIRDVNF